MADISAQDVAALRKQTGAGMMDCKKALQENGGDLDAAKDWLRTKGLMGASKREGRSAEQGAVDVVVEAGVGALVELNCETDFVAKGSDFRDTLASLARLVATSAGAASDLPAAGFAGATVADALTLLGSKMGEKIELGRVHRYETAGGLVDGYKHVQNDRGVIGVLVELDGVDPGAASARETAHAIALHIASAAPRYLGRDDVPPDVLDKEREVLTELTRNEGKPEAALPKIVEGRINGFYKDAVLLEQPFVRDPKTTIAAVVAGLGTHVAIRRFARVKVGEG